MHTPLTARDLPRTGDGGTRTGVACPPCNDDAREFCASALPRSWPILADSRKPRTIGLLKRPAAFSRWIPGPSWHRQGYPSEGPWVPVDRRCRRRRSIRSTPAHIMTRPARPSALRSSRPGIHQPGSARVHSRRDVPRSTMTWNPLPFTKAAPLRPHCGGPHLYQFTVCPLRKSTGNRTPEIVDPSAARMSASAACRRATASILDCLHVCGIQVTA